MKAVACATSLLTITRKCKHYSARRPRVSDRWGGRWTNEAVEQTDARQGCGLAGLQTDLIHFSRIASTLRHIFSHSPRKSSLGSSRRAVKWRWKMGLDASDWNGDP